jgi:hypothetical protein
MEVNVRPFAVRDKQRTEAAQMGFLRGLKEVT